MTHSSVELAMLSFWKNGLPTQATNGCKTKGQRPEPRHGFSSAKFVEMCGQRSRQVYCHAGTRPKDLKGNKSSWKLLGSAENVIPSTTSERRPASAKASRSTSPDPLQFWVSNHSPNGRDSEHRCCVLLKWANFETCPGSYWPDSDNTEDRTGTVGAELSGKNCNRRAIFVAKSNTQQQDRLGNRLEVVSWRWVIQMPQSGNKQTNEAGVQEVSLPRPFHALYDMA